MMTGLCSNCPSLVEGRSCNVCVANSFGDPSMGCMVSIEIYFLLKVDAMMLCIFIAM